MRSVSPDFDNQSDIKNTWRENVPNETDNTPPVAPVAPQPSSAPQDSPAASSSQPAQTSPAPTPAAPPTASTSPVPPPSSGDAAQKSDPVLDGLIALSKGNSAKAPGVPQSGGSVYQKSAGAAGNPIALLIGVLIAGVCVVLYMRSQHHGKKHAGDAKHHTSGGVHE